MKYDAYEPLVAPARASAGLPLLCLGLFLIGLIHITMIQGLFALLRSGMSDEAFFDLALRIQRADTPLALLTVLVLTGSMALGVFVVVPTLHKRPVGSLFGEKTRAFQQFWTVLKPLAVLIAVFWAVTRLLGATGLEPGLPPSTWVFLLPATLAALLIQTGAEELIFRGYIQSQLAARFSSPTVWLLAPSALFAILHYQPEVFGENAPYLVIWSFLFGVAAADLTARSGSLGPAIAMHLANNFSALALVALRGDMSGLALWQLPYGPGDTEMIRAQIPVEFLFIPIYWLAARLSLRL